MGPAHTPCRAGCACVLGLACFRHPATVLRLACPLCAYPRLLLAGGRPQAVTKSKLGYDPNPKP